MDIKEKANKEYEDILTWYMNEEDRIRGVLIKNGKYREGLDANSKYFKPLYEEALRRIEELRKKYGAI